MMNTRVRSLVQGCAALAAAALLFWALHRPIPAAIVAVLGVCLLVTGQLFPRAFGVIDAALGRAVRWAGTIVAWCILAPFYLIVFTLLRLLLALARKDPLTRAPRGTATTAWVGRHPTPRTIDDYRHLY